MLNMFYSNYYTLDIHELFMMDRRENDRFQYCETSSETLFHAFVQRWHEVEIWLR